MCIRDSNQVAAVAGLGKHETGLAELDQEPPGERGVTGLTVHLAVNG